MLDDSTITIPSDDNAIVELLDELFDGSCYERFFPDRTDVIDWTQTDVDDFDSYEVNYQNMLDIDSFYDKMLDSLHDNYYPGDVIDKDELKTFVERVGNDIFDYAEEHFDPEEAGCELFWKGSHGHSYYY